MNIQQQQQQQQQYQQQQYQLQQQQYQQQQQQLMGTNSQVEQADSVESTAEAPPKQVALAMERLSQAARLIADIRIGADRLMEALFVNAQSHQLNKQMHLLEKEESIIRQDLQDLRNVGRQLEESGVLNGSLKSRSNSWGLHMPLVCPDGAVVAYAWKRQLAGQAGASAVDRTRLALKAFTDQKRRFFPHLEDESSGEYRTSKKHCGPQESEVSHKEVLTEDKTLPSVLMRLEKEVPNIRISTYQRLDWLKRATSLLSSPNETSTELSKELNFNSSNKLRTGAIGVVTMDQVAVIELFLPSVFRAIVSLHPAGSIDPDSVAFFSPDEGGSYMHARGFSVHHVFKRVTEHAVKALQYFASTDTDRALYNLLCWIVSYQTLFTKACSKCGRLLKIDRQSALTLPPVHRTYRDSSATKVSPIQSTESTKDQGLDLVTAYHIGCSAEES